MRANTYLQSAEKDTSSTNHNFFNGNTIFPKLTINAPNDKYEQEADAMATKVMTMPESGIQRKCTACEEEEKESIQRKELEESPSAKAMGDEEEEMLQTKSDYSGGMQASSALQSQLNASKGVGSPLPDNTNRSMSNAFGADFSGVRVHTGQQANDMNQSIQAKAFTHGSDIYFRNGQYNPGSSEGKHLLAHELTHTIQQTDPLKENRNSKLIQREIIDHGGRQFMVGEVRLHGRASIDVRRHGVLFPGPDQAHILVTGDGRLGYEVNHQYPNDPFRWGKLKDIVDSGIVDIHAVAFPGPFTAKEISNGQESVVNRNLFQVGASGITLVRKSVSQSINPRSTVRVVSANDSRDTIFYQSGSGGRGLIGDNALAHELFGHLWLSLKGVPFLHPPAGSLREIQEGTLSESHDIRDPFRNVFAGTVREYIDAFIGAESGALESPTQGVSNELLESSLENLHRELNNANGLVRNGNSLQVSPDVHLQWAFVSNNYEALLHTDPQQSFGRSINLSDGVLRLIVEWFESFNEDQKFVFREFLSGVQNPTRGRVHTSLARHVQREVRR